MVKVSPMKAITLMTALATGTACVAQNRLQNAHKKFVTEEFRKADVNPQDFFVSQAELDAYMGNSNTKVAKFDINKDNLLNIDEFTSIIVPQQKTQQTKTKIQKPKKTQGEIIKEANKIYDDLKYYSYNPTGKKTVPGRFWGTNTYNYFEEGKIVSIIKRINKDNLIAVVNKFHKNEHLSGKARISNIENMAEWGIGHNEEIYLHLCNTLQELGNARGMGKEVHNILVSYGYNRLDKAYDFIIGQ